MSKILQVEHLVQEFNLTKDFLDKVKFKKGRFSLENQVVHAVNDVSFDVEQGEVFSLVGESGCGKSTTARTVIKLIEPKAGKITFDGRDITRLKPQEMRPVRREMQMIFQDPYASLNPRQKVMEILTEPMLFHKLCTRKAEAEEKAVNLLERVGLSSEQANRYPHQFSGGQRQRIGIARTLALQPKLLIADEAVSALDVSVQAQIINLLEELQKSLHLTMLFISHDLSVVRCMTDRAVVMYLGKIMEMGPTEHLFGAPAHPYTRNLIDAVPEPDPDCPAKESTMIGEPPSPMDIPGGCRFHPRCPYAKNVCRRAQPELTDLGGGHFAACHFPYACAGVPQTEAEQ